jgi:hypothetical protein
VSDTLQPFVPVFDTLQLVVEVRYDTIEQ